MKYREMTAEQRKAEFEKVSAEFEAWKAKGLKLNMARGRPGKEQLDLVSDILSVMTDPADCVDGDVNVRNYGQLSGLPSAKALFAEILGCKPEQVFVGGNASLQLMYDTIAKAYTNGLLHSENRGAARSISSGSAPRRAMTATSRSRRASASSSSPFP